LAVVRLAHAGPDAPTKPVEQTDADAAEKLFEKGRLQKDRGDLKGACETFDQALKLNRNAVGTILNVALCDEQAGKIATAWKLFTEARARAEEQRLEEHRKAAAEHSEKLKDRLPHLALAFAEKPTSDTKIVVDNEIVPLSDNGEVPNIAIDPGTRTVVVNAPGRVAYETKVEMVEGKITAVAIPKLAFPVTVHKGRRTVGKILTYSGVGLVAAGIGIGLYARRTYNREFDIGHCITIAGAAPSCTTEGYSKTRDARTYGWVGTGIGGLGLVAAGIGTVLWFFGPTETDKLAILPSITPEQAGLTAIGHF
jgi:hypothetical protein